MQPMACRTIRAAVLASLLLILGCSRAGKPQPVPASRIPMTGPLIAASVSMKAAWEYPKNPLVDKMLDS